MITQEYIKSVLHYDSSTGIFTWTKNAIPKMRNKIAGTITKKGYINIDVMNKCQKAHRLAWLYVYGYIPKNQIDHINHNKSDNRIKNLREATPQQNQFNKKITTRNTSGFKGVSFHNLTKKWRAAININKKTKYLGEFNSPEEASFAYNSMAKKIHGVFAHGIG